jgi:hypothetical protein
MALPQSVELAFYVTAWYVGNTFYNIVSLAAQRVFLHLFWALVRFVESDLTRSFMFWLPFLLAVQQEGPQPDPRALVCGLRPARRKPPSDPLFNILPSLWILQLMPWSPTPPRFGTADGSAPLR